MATPAKVTKSEGKNNHDAADEQAGKFANWNVRLRLHTYTCGLIRLTCFFVISMDWGSACRNTTLVFRHVQWLSSFVSPFFEDWSATPAWFWVAVNIVFRWVWVLIFYTSWFIVNDIQHCPFTEGRKINENKCPPQAGPRKVRLPSRKTKNLVIFVSWSLFILIDTCITLLISGC